MRVLICIMAEQIKNPPAMQETQEMQVWSLGQKDPVEEEMATHSSIFAWKIPWMEESGGLQSIGSQRVRQSWATNAFIPIDALDLMKYGNGISIWKLLK